MLTNYSGDGDMVNKNQRLKWAKEHNFEIDEQILEKEIRGIYGFFIGKECVYVGRSYNIYARLFSDSDCHMKKIQQGNHVGKVIKAVKAGEKITIRVLEIVEKQNDHPAKDAQRLASKECGWIDYFQAMDQCLEQYPEGRWGNRYKFWGWRKANVPPITDEYKGIKNPRDLYDALSEIWCAETCAPRMRENWTEENKTLGQCSITAFLAQVIFGGKVYGIERPGGNFHCYNVVGDCAFDLTSEQFGDEKLDYKNNPEQFREVHFAKEEKRLRYELLKTNLRKEFM